MVRRELYCDYCYTPVRGTHEWSFSVPTPPYDTEKAYLCQIDSWAMVNEAGFPNLLARAILERRNRARQDYA